MRFTWFFHVGFFFFLAFRVNQIDRKQQHSSYGTGFRFKWGGGGDVSGLGGALSSPNRRRRPSVAISLRLGFSRFVSPCAFFLT